MAVSISVMVLESYIPGAHSPGGKNLPKSHPSGSDQVRYSEANQVTVGGQVILFCGFNQAVDYSARLGTSRGVGKEQVLPAHCKRLYATTVVGELQSAILQIVSLLSQIVQCLALGEFESSLVASLICPCQQSVQNRFLQFQPLGIAFFRCQVHESLLQLKQPGAVTLADCLQRILPFLFGQHLQRFVKFSPGMSPAAHHPDVLRKLVVALVAVRVQPAREVLEEGLGVLRLPAGLVLVQDKGILSAAASSVEPLVGLAGRSPARILQHLQRGLISMRHGFLAQSPVHHTPAAARCLRPTGSSWPWSAGTASTSAAETPAPNGTMVST